MKKQLTFCLALLALLCTSAYAQLPSYLPADGLVGWWPFNGNANDESGNGNHGVVNGGTTLTNDRFDVPENAYSVDGLNCEGPRGISVPVSLNSASDWSISLWFKSLNPEDSYQCVFNSMPQRVIGVAVNRPPYPMNSIYSLQGNGSSWSALDDVVFDIGEINEWRNISVTQSNSMYRYYVDGILYFNQDISSIIGNSDFSIVLGAVSTNEGPNCFEPLNGLIDDIAIYNRALTEQEIQNLYTATNTGNTLDTGDGAAPLPQGIPYQAAARDGNGQPVVDSPVNVRFSLREGAADGATSFIESHNLTTNSIGLFNTVLGNGTPEQSVFDSINWAATTKFLQVEIDLGSGYVDMGTTQLLSVPYAFRSAQAATLKNAALPIYPDNTAALAGGLVAWEMYRTASGDLKIVY